MRSAAHRAATTAIAGSLVLGCAGATLAGCASTTYDAGIASDNAPATSTTLPRGTAADLLPLLVAEAGRLSGEITSRGSPTEVAERVAAYWDAVAQEVGRERPELLGDFEANIVRCTNAARFRRPADADKAYRNLVVLTDTFLGSQR